MNQFLPRPAQEEVLQYQAGLMGVSAVPGSGKTVTLSYLAARLIATGNMADDQEVLIVTLVNSAVDNFSSRIAASIKELGLLPGMGYRVRTLHGLARDIVGERPDLAGLSDNFEIIDERAANQILEDVVHAWLRTNPYALDEYLRDDIDENQRDWIHSNKFPEFVRDIASAFIRRAKDWQLIPGQIGDHLSNAPAPLPLAEMGHAIYRDYQRALAYRGAVDFDDLIRLAVEALQIDNDLLERLRYRWPYILEDEAQDSSRLQEHILRLLVGENGNWVRVGDPNQAIFETFTTADPVFLRNFLKEDGVYEAALPNSGRSTKSVMDLANRLIDWVQWKHPVEPLREALAPPHIQPTPPGDPQPNPPDDPSQVYLVNKKFTPQQELNAVVDSLERWLPENQKATVAVLVPRNTRGFAVVEELRRRKIAYKDNLRSATTTRLAAGALGNILNYLADPKSSAKLARAFEVWRRGDREDEDVEVWIKTVAGKLRKCREVETFLWPTPSRNWLDDLNLENKEPDTHTALLEFRKLVRRWQEATSLPIDQLVLTIAQDLFQEPGELALSHKLALVLKRAAGGNIDWGLPELTSELGVIARNERRFIGFSDDDTGFDPDKHKGIVVVTTMHKAKGLEWDRVYLMSVNNYDFPSAQEFDHYIAEKWYIRDRLDMQVEALEQLRVLLSTEEFEWFEEGVATQDSRFSYAEERLRLLYVGITRAKKELVVTWNSGRKSDLQQAIPFVALQSYWTQNHVTSS